jgi:cytochrome c oxidase subunit 3
MNLFVELTRKPWLPVPEGELVDGPMIPLPRSSVGFRIFIGIVCFLFILMVGAYADRIILNDWRAMPEVPTLWLNTVLLVAASLAMRTAARRLGGDLTAVKKLLGGSVVLSIAFVAGQLAAWDELVSLGYLASANPANAFFYMITGLHGVHVLGGLVVLLNASIKVWGGADGERLRTHLRLCATYWHFLLIVWLILFALFLFT